MTNCLWQAYENAKRSVTCDVLFLLEFHINNTLVVRSKNSTRNLLFNTVSF
uniref:Uncharacterized protein n=1 Tax=Anguilla anguilla TaxID=7936 RepID=A0A0E9VV74_ANGAN